MPNRSFESHVFMSYFFRLPSIASRSTVMQLAWFRSVTALLLVGILFPGWAEGQDADDVLPEHPNVLWITVEDMSPRLPSYGDSTAVTPNIDRLAEEGVRYTRFFANVPVCAPARSSIITGMYATSYGAQHMRTMRRTAALSQITDPELLAIPTYEAVPPPEAKMFPEYLRAHGYYTTNNGKEDYQFAPPETAWDESSGRAHWRNRPDPDQPFFAVFNIGATHESQVWERADDPMDIDTSLVELPPYYPDTPIVRRDLARHYDNIQIMDSEVGEILQQLEEDGLLEETIVFFFSDHGDGLPRAKRWLYDSGLHVPFIIRWPDGRDTGTIDEELHSFVDLAPTMLSLANIPIPDHMQGQAFLGEQRSPPRRYVYATKDRMDPALDNARATRDTRFKYIYNYHPDRPFVQFLPYRDQMALMRELLQYHEEDRLEGPERLWFRQTKPAEELYDTVDDPHEINNLADDPAYREKLEELRAELVRWQEETGDLALIPETELIKKLWPPDGVQPETAPVQIEYPSTEFEDAVTVSLASATDGASIGYRLDDDPVWQVYTGPFQITESATLHVHAHRIGFGPSRIDSIRFVKSGP